MQLSSRSRSQLFGVVSLGVVDTREDEKVGILLDLGLVDNVLEKLPLLFFVPNHLQNLVQPEEALEYGVVVVLVLGYSNCLEDRVEGLVSHSHSQFDLGQE